MRQAAGLHERDTAGLGQRLHLGQRFALQFGRQRAQRVRARAGRFARALAQHSHQARLVERRIGVRRAHHTGDSARERRLHFDLQCAFVPRFAQARAQIDQAGRNDQALCIECAIDLEVAPAPGRSRQFARPQCRRRPLDRIHSPDRSRAR